MVLSHFQRTRPECENESLCKTGRQKKIDCFSVDGFCSHCNTVFEAKGCFYHFCLCQGLRPSLTEEVIQRGSKKREIEALRRIYMQEKGLKVIEMWECEWKRLHKTTNTVKQHIREHFPYRRSLAAEQLLEEIKKGKIFGYVQFDIEVSEDLRENNANFPPMLKNTFVSKSDIEPLLKIYAEEARLLFQPRKMLISSFTIQNRTLLCCCFIYNWVLFAQKYTALLSTLQRNASTVFCSQQWTQEGKVTKIQTQVSSQKQ